jgi:CDP-glycerol glycerophosphotransferase
MPLIQDIKAYFKRNKNLFYYVWPIHWVYRKGVMTLTRLVLGVDQNKVVFSSFYSKFYNDNPRYISEKLHEMRPETDIVWLFRKSAIRDIQVPDYVRKVQPISLKGLVEQATARVWVDNVKKSEALAVGRKQYYINTWHGDRGFKRVGADNDKRKIKKLRRLERKCALMVAGSQFGESTYRTAFGYQGEVMRMGCPRNDILLKGDPKTADRVRKGLNIPADAKVLIYAPTYRDTNKDNHASEIDLNRTLRTFEEVTGRRWVCLYRAHYMSRGLKVKDLGNRLIDASKWPEMAELLLISDALISDYSSCTCDFTLTGRPAFLYIDDLGDYVDNNRELYFDLEASPFLLARNMDELEKLIRETDTQAARQNSRDLNDFFGANETGSATEAVCQYIIDQLA